MFRLSCLLAVLVLGPLPAVASGAPPAANSGQTPTIVSAGRMHEAPQAAYQPDPKLTYKVVFNITRGAQKPSQINPGIERVARAVNLFTHAGVPLDHLKFVAIASGGATPAVLQDAYYQKQFGVANPNLAVIAELRKAGVDVAVCAQAIPGQHFEFDWVDPNVTVALSSLTTVTALQQQGYALMPL